MKRTAMKRVRRSTGPTPATRKLVLERDGGCVACGATRDLHIHHRKPRRVGGRRRHPKINDATNLVVLCGTHHEWTESHRLEALGYGWLVMESDDPATVPIVHHRHAFAYLLADGTWDAEPHAEEAL